MDKNEIYGVVTLQIAQDKLDDAIKTLWSHFDNEQILLQSARLQSIKNEIISGTISFEKAEIEKNKIRKAILSLAVETKKEYSQKAKNRIFRKLKLFANLFKKEKQNRIVIFFSLLFLLHGGKLKTIGLSIAILALTLIGANYIIKQNDKLLIQTNNSVVSNSEPKNIQDSLFSILKVADDSITFLTNELKISKLEIDKLRDTILKYSTSNPSPVVIDFEDTQVYRELRGTYLNALEDLESELEELKISVVNYKPNGFSKDKKREWNEIKERINNLNSSFQNAKRKID